MTTLRQAAQQALEALDVATTPLAKDRQEVLLAKAALRAALEEPVALGDRKQCTYPQCKTTAGCSGACSKGRPLFHPEPPQRKPLTDELLRTLHHEDEFGLFCDYNEFEQIARAIEAAHGIKEGK